MKINGWDIAEIGAKQSKQWNVIPGFHAVNNDSEWIRGGPIWHLFALLNHFCFYSPDFNVDCGTLHSEVSGTGFLHSAGQFLQQQIQRRKALPEDQESRLRCSCKEGKRRV